MERIIKKLRIVIPRLCPNCKSRSLRNDYKTGGVRCSVCGLRVSTIIEDSSWFFSSQDTSVLIDLPKRIEQERKRKVPEVPYEAIL